MCKVDASCTFYPSLSQDALLATSASSPRWCWIWWTTVVPPFLLSFRFSYLSLWLYARLADQHRLEVTMQVRGGHRTKHASWMRGEHEERDTTWHAYVIANIHKIRRKTNFFLYILVLESLLQRCPHGHELLLSLILLHSRMWRFAAKHVRKLCKAHVYNPISVSTYSLCSILFSLCQETRHHCDSHSNL